MPPRLRPLLATLFVAALALVLPLSAQAAGPTYAVKAFTVTVGSGGSVSTTASLASNPASTAAQYGVCVRDASSRVVDFAPKLTNVTLMTSGTAYNATKTFSAGTYRANVCYQPVGGAFTTAGAAKTFTVAATSSPSPTPTPSPSVPPSPSPTPSPTAPAVLFSDDFSGSAGAAYDHTKWGEWSGCTYNKAAYYGKIGCGDRATLDGQGHLSIPATPNQGTSISTKDHFTFTYGTMTARMKVPVEGGYWPAFWAANNNPNGTDASVIGEVDAHESYTALANYYHVAVHNYSSQSWSGAMDPACGRDHVFGEWHDYSAKVEPGRVSFYFDGAMCGSYVTKDEGAGKPYGFGPDTTRGLWPILTLAVGGAGGQQDGKATQDAVLLVDRVEVTAV